MLLSREWLSEFTDTSNIDDKEFANAMTLSGSKVETVEKSCGEIKNIVVGKIVEMVRHENSDHMWVCQVDVGREEPIQIVTGAQNQNEGDLIPTALDGAVLPDGKQIHSGKLRGVPSDGMLCSYQELGFTDNDWPHSVVNGLFVMNTDPDLMAMDPKPGDSIEKYIGADDTVVDFEITPNRPDCLSVIGLAREASATFKTPLKLHTPVVKGTGGSAAELVSITIDNETLCRRYTARMVKNVRIAPSPLWLRRRLRASGVRPISNIVDITNYVMLEYGQPMHAFDFSCVEGGRIIVRTARGGETIETLDGTARKLDESMLCICDGNKPVCVAGVMGGANSEITGDTAMILFEAANFDGASVRKTALSLGMRTESSSRFEKGLDVEATIKAVNRACELVELLGCGEVVDGIVDVYPNPEKPRSIKLEPDKINALLGTNIAADDMREYLKTLDFTVSDDDTVGIPSFRGDVERMPDLAEEVARFYGYNNIPYTLQRGASTRGGYMNNKKLENAVTESCRSDGFSEIITYSFTSPSALDRIRVPSDSPLRKRFKILNPLGEDTSVMRTSALPNMLETLARNKSARNENVRLYELARIYLMDEKYAPLAYEPKILSLGAYGEGVDFYSFKGVIENILDAANVKDARFAAVKDNPSYHPGRCAKITSGDTEIGVFGELHPKTAANYGLDAGTMAAELSFPALEKSAGEEATYTPLPKFPPITRDIAVVCDKSVTVERIMEVMRESGGENLKSVSYFDEYEGAGIPENKRSTAYSLLYRSDTRTLTDSEVDAATDNVVKALKEKLGAERR